MKGADTRRPSAASPTSAPHIRRRETAALGSTGVAGRETEARGLVMKCAYSYLAI
jgi:hypothetical protein